MGVPYRKAPRLPVVDTLSAVLGYDGWCIPISQSCPPSRHVPKMSTEVTLNFSRTKIALIDLECLYSNLKKLVIIWKFNLISEASSLLKNNVLEKSVEFDLKGVSMRHLK